jgi:hypothetical protein
MRWCECEHVCHHQPTEGLEHHLRPEDCCTVTVDLRTVHTIYGRFLICGQCQADHPIPPEYLETVAP